MKKIWIGVLAALLVAPTGYAKQKDAGLPPGVSPLQLTIESDKTTYEIGDEITIASGLINISEKKIVPGKFMQAGHLAHSLRFRNERGETCELIHLETTDEAVPGKLMPGQTASLWSYPFVPLEGGKYKLGRYQMRVQEGRRYSFEGKQEIYLEAYGLTSNTITIEVEGPK